MARYIDADALLETLKGWQEDSAMYDGAGNPVESILCDVIHHVENAPTADVVPMAEWISVEERLPEDNERVLCFIPDWVERNVGPVIVQFGWCCKRRNMGISHWMPLPEPPKGE